MDFKTKIEKQDTEEIVNSKYINWEHFKNSTILVTGATGMIGSQIVKAILYANEIKGVNIKIVALVRNKKKAEKLYGFNNIKYIVQNIEKPVKPNFSPDYIIHTANSTSSKEFTEKPVETLNSIITGTKNILEFARKSSIKGILYLSSMEVYGYTDFDRSEPLKETDYGYIDILNSRNSYPVGKQLAESMCFAYAKEYGVPVKIARLCQTIGSGVDFNDNRVFAQFARNVAKKEDIVLKTTGETTRSYCYITDAVSAIFSLLERGQNGEAYNIANSDATCSIKEMAEMLTEKYTSSKLIIEPQENKEYLGKIRLVLNTSKIESLNWKPTIRLDEMYDRLIENFNKIGRIYKKRIILVVLENANIGDSIIADTCEYLLKNTNSDFDIVRLNLFPEAKLYKRLNVRYTYTYPRWKRIWKFIKYRLYSLPWSSIYKHYSRTLKDADGVIFAGGGIIKHTLEAFWNPIYTIVNYCDKHNIPVYFNAVGIEGYDSNNYFSNLLKKILNNKIINKITTRDDIESLNYYVNDKSKIDIVGDPALWTKEAYNINKQEKSSTIGVGVVRGKIFTDYGTDYNEESISESYVSLINELEKRGYKWQLFCNGIESDYNMGLNILDKLGIEPNEQNIAKRPLAPIDLITLISNYKATISARLHANIVAVSLEIPTIGYVWNDKLKLFGKLIGCPNRFLNKEQFSDSTFVVDTLEEALQIGYDKAKINNLRNKTYEKLSEFINQNCKG